MEKSDTTAPATHTNAPSILAPEPPAHDQKEHAPVQSLDTPSHHALRFVRQVHVDPSACESLTRRPDTLKPIKHAESFPPIFTTRDVQNIFGE